MNNLLIKFILFSSILTTLSSGAFFSGLLIGANKKKISDKIKKMSLKKNNSASLEKNSDK